MVIASRVLNRGDNTDQNRGDNTDQDGRYCLNDLHWAAGGESEHQPGFFMRRKETQELIEAVARASANSQTPSAPVVTINDGVGKQIVYAYAM